MDVQIAVLQSHSPGRHSLPRTQKTHATRDPLLEVNKATTLVARRNLHYGATLANVLILNPVVSSKTYVPAYRNLCQIFVANRSCNGTVRALVLHVYNGCSLIIS